MHRVALVVILLAKNNSESIDDIPRILFKQCLHSQVEVLVSLHSRSIMENCRHEVTVLDVHVLESEVLLESVELIKQGLLEVGSLNVEDCNKAVIIASVAHEMVHVSQVVVNIDGPLDCICWCTEPCHQVKSYVFKAEKA